MTDYRSVAIFVPDNLDVNFVVSEDDLDSIQMVALAHDLGFHVDGRCGWWVMRRGLPVSGTEAAIKAIASHPHWLTLESGEAEEQESK